MSFERPDSPVTVAAAIPATPSVLAEVPVAAIPAVCIASSTGATPAVAALVAPSSCVSTSAALHRMNRNTQINPCIYIVKIKIESVGEIK